MINKMISHYKILDKLGEGGMGVVYKAEDTKLKRLVALKLLPAHISESTQEKARFIHEAQTASALNHPNITTIYEIDEFEGQMFIAMEYCEGETLKKIIERKTLSVKKVLDIGIQICEGLLAAHKKGIIHRDIKSENMMVTQEAKLKITDFGLAKLKGATTLTKAGSTLGTAAYMSPEQASGEELDSRSDIFSFGVVLYEMLTGQLPFKGEHEAAIIYSVINETPEPLARFKADVPEELQRIVDKALAKEKEERYQHIDDLLADLRREKKSLEYVKAKGIVPEASEIKPKKTLLPFIIPASMVFVVVLLLFILKPFQVEIIPEKQAVAEENTLAIMYFENLVDKEDKEKLGEIVTNLLITDLSESQFMNVVSSQRLYDILKLLGREGAKIIDKNVASEIAKKAKAKWMLLGNILQTEPQIILASQLVDVAGGRVVASQRIEGEVGEKIFSMVDKLTVEVKEDLSLPAHAQKEKDPKVADVTTHSPEAYRFYLEGLDFFGRYYSVEAEKSFKKALEFDTTFAMAYFRLAQMEGGAEQKRLIAKAEKYSDKVTQKEKHYIKSLEANISGDYAQEIEELKKLVERYPEEKEAFLILGEIYHDVLRKPEEAIGHLTKAVEIDPLYQEAYNLLAYTYSDMGDLDKSIWAINKYISLAPDEANPYDSRADLYAYNGKLDQAIKSYKKALEIEPAFHTSLFKLGHMYLFKREYSKAESCYKELASSDEKNLRSRGRADLALIPLHQGKFEEALKVLEDGIAADRMEQAEGFFNITKHFLAASIYEQKKKLNLALKEADICTEIHKKAFPQDPVNMREFCVYILAQSDEISKAEEVARALKKDIEEKNQAFMYVYCLASGIIELAKGNAEAAVFHLRRGVEEAPPPLFSTRFFPLHFFLAKAYLKSGRVGEAVDELERVLLRYDALRTGVPIWSAKAHYLLGLAYEKSGWTKKAIEKYEEFLEIWKDADPGIEEVEDAKNRLKKLKIQS